MSQEIDDFLFSSQAQPAAQQIVSRPAYQPQAALPTQKPERATVEMPSASEISAPVVEAASQVKAGAPKPKPESVVHQIVDEISNNWKPILFTAGAIAGAEVGRRYLANRSVTKAAEKEQKIKERIEPTFAPETPAQTEDRLQQLKDRVIAGQQAGLGAKPELTIAPEPVVPGPIQRAQLPQGPSIFSSGPKAPRPSIVDAIITGQNGTEIAKAVATEELLTPTEKAPEKSADTGVTGRTRRTNAQIEAERAAAIAAAPPGMLPAAPKKTNKLYPTDVLGQGGYHWLTSQEGANAPAVWRDLFGDKNVSYEQAVEKYNTMMAGGEPGKFPIPEGHPTTKRQKFVPEHIKGAASPGALAATAAMAAIPALAVAGKEYYQGNKEGVNASLKDAWDSLKSVVTMPYDVAKAASKGDFGPFKDLLMSVNPATLLMNEVGKHDQAAINQMIQRERQAATVGAGRGVAPPSAYQR